MELVFSLNTPGKQFQHHACFNNRNRFNPSASAQTIIVSASVPAGNQEMNRVLPHGRCPPPTMKHTPNPCAVTLQALEPRSAAHLDVYSVCFMMPEEVIKWQSGAGNSPGKMNLNAFLHQREPLFRPILRRER